MRTVLPTLLLLTLASTAGAIEAPAPATPRGMLEVAERVYHAGKVDRGVTFRHTFLLKNIGMSELSIDAKPG